MDINEINDILTNNIPKKEAWNPCFDEPYGLFNKELLKTNDIKKILYCVTPTSDVIDYFNKNNYDLLFSHHPFIVDVPQFIAHTAFDCCNGGLNDFWRDKLDIKSAIHFDGNLGWYGIIEPIKFNDLMKKISQITNQPPQSFNSNVDVVKNVVICTGLGGLVSSTVAKLDPDCYITGEGITFSAQQNMFKSYIEIGHTLSEQVGIYKIRELLPEVNIDIAPLSIDYFNDFEYLTY